jgi:hypothetical protein
VQDRLTIVRPVALGDALAGAVRGICARPITVAPRDLTLLDARLACGDFESILALLRAAPPAPALPLFVARYVRWTGDLQSAAGMWHNTVASLEPALADMESALRRASCLELASTASDLGDAQLAARLHGIARTIDIGTPPPMQADRDTVLVCEAAFGTIGIEPDAARGRLRLRPRLDRLDELHARHIRFGDASVSLHAVRDDAALTIRVEQDAGSIPITLLLEPFVVRPGPASVDGRPADLAPQSVDGQPTDVAARPDHHASATSERGTIVPVQLVLDDTRTLVIHTPRENARKRKGPVT